MKRQREKRDQPEGQVQPGVPANAEPDGAEVGVGVAEQQSSLKEDQAGIPHGRRAAELREHRLGTGEFDQENQGGAEQRG